MFYLLYRSKVISVSCAGLGGGHLGGTDYCEGRCLPSGCLRSMPAQHVIYLCLSIRVWSRDSCHVNFDPCYAQSRDRCQIPLHFGKFTVILSHGCVVIFRHVV